jgi:DNA repair exonuclease SbcCD nuclease subunit
MVKVRVLHISDIHLESPFKSLGPKGRERRLELKENFEEVLNKADEFDVDAVLIAGDLYEANYSTRDLGNFMSRCFRYLNVPVVIAPGNHDPYTKNSLYSLVKWPDNVHIFKENFFECLVLDERVVIYGIANTGFNDNINHLSTLKVDAELPTIGIMHGSYLPYSSLLPESNEACLPFTEDDLMNSKLNYLALGHYHKYAEIKIDGVIRGVYPGTLEPLNFDEIGERNAVIVEIGKDGIKIEKIPTGVRNYEILEIDCSSASCAADIITKIKLSSISQRNIVKIVLKGEVDPSIDLNVGEIEIAARKHFYHAIVENRIRPSYDIDSISREQTLRGEFVRRMLQKIEQNPEEREILMKALYYGLEAFDNDRREVTIQ